MPPTSSIRRPFASLLVLAPLLFAPRSPAADPPPALMVAGPPASTATVATSPKATATVATSPPVRAPKTLKRWYGWQLLIAYAAADALLASGVGLIASGVNEGIWPAVIGSIAHAAIGPVAHLAHRRDRAVIAGAVALEVLMPLTGLAIGRNVVPRCKSDSEPACYALSGRALAGGAIAGVVSAGIIEVAAFSYEPIPSPRRPSSSFGIAPLVSRRELGLSVAGTF